MESHGVTVQSVQALRGPNLYAYKPVLLTYIDIGPYETRPSTSFPGVVDRLTAWLPGLWEHQCGVGKPGGFVERLRTGTYLGHIVEHITLELQNRMGFDVAFGRARGTDETGVYRVVIEYQEEIPAREAFATALRLTLAAMHEEPFDIANEIDGLQSIADDYRLGPSTAAVVAAARDRGIPFLRITPRDSLVQLGYGIHQKRIQASETSLTSAIAVGICQQKPLTNALLRAVGVPVPEGRSVKSPDDAWDAAAEIGLPVVVKPEDGNQGKGVSTDLTIEAQVRSAYGIAEAFHRGVMVERAIQGNDYRLLVVGGKLVAAARRDPAQIIGDGKQSVRSLVEAANADPRRRPGHASILTRIQLDASVDLVLAQQGLSIESIPATGQAVRLRSNGNLSTGGTAVDVTDAVHPDNARLCELAAQILALDVAGVDAICHDISRPIGPQGGAIVEVNAAPGLRMHLHPAAGQPRNVARPIVEMLYPNSVGRIPIIAVTGTNGKTTVTRLIAHLYHTDRRLVGMTTTEGTYIGRERIIAGDCSGPRSARAVLLHPRVEVAVLETARGGILREGLAFDRCTVGVVTNLSADHLGLGGIQTIGDLAKVKQVVVEVADRNGAAVLNADDPRVAEMAAATNAPVIFFSRHPESPIVTAHLASGGRAVIVDDDFIVLASGGVRTRLVEIDRLTFTAGGRIRFQVENALAATAAAWGAGVNPAIMIRGLTTFETDRRTTPGRMNVSETGGVQLILDYGHNPAALNALGEALQALGKRRTILALTLPGDRRDDDIRAAVQSAMRFADAFVLYDSRERRGRAIDEIPRLIERELPPLIPRTIVADQQAAIRSAYAWAQPGDRVVVVVVDIEEAFAAADQLALSAVSDAACFDPIAETLASW